MYNEIMMDVDGLIFDYGGTLDTNSVHWSEVLWKGYQNAGVPVTKDVFRDAYVHGERTLAKNHIIKPHHNFLDLLKIKVEIETGYLRDCSAWLVDEPKRLAISDSIAEFCYNHVLRVLERSREILRCLSEKYPMVLVSNFYGNINTILDDFKLKFFDSVIESAVVGIRKPDPRIFQLGVDALKMPAERTVVIGDSYSKDIVPAHSIGCRTIWIKGIGWDGEEDKADASSADVIINDLKNLMDLL